MGPRPLPLRDDLDYIYRYRFEEMVAVYFWRMMTGAASPPTFGLPDPGCSAEMLPGNR
jgi:hypothetical protein